MTVFSLYADSEVRFEGETTPGITHFIQVLIRDLATALEPSEKASRVTFIMDDKKFQQLEAEQFELEVVDEKQLHVHARDELGVIYAILHVSEVFLGIDKFWFWNDLLPEKKQQVDIKESGYVSPKAEVRYRGWFVNDEVLVANWQAGTSQEYVWQMIFEALLRSKGNMVIPGTDLKNHTYTTIAMEMGLWITHHHAEPLGAEMFSRAYPDEMPSYVENKELFIGLWTDAIKRQKDNKVIWNIGFRGQGDRPFWSDDPTFDTDEKRGKLIGEIITEQYNLISRYQTNPVCCVNLYGEVTDLYQKGLLELPESVIKIWADSGYGKMVSRRQNNHNPRILSQPEAESEELHGIYYHITFYDLQASNHLTMFPNECEFINQELSQSFDLNMNHFLIVNCGNLRPHLLYLDLVSQIWQKGQIETEEFLDHYTATYYPETHEAVKKLLRDYQAAILNYGEHADERAGEQLYYYAIRYLVSAWLKQEPSTKALYWATGEVPLTQQFAWFKAQLAPKKVLWQSLLADCQRTMTQANTAEEERLFNQLLVQIEIQEAGVTALLELVTAYELFSHQDCFKSFLKVNKAIEALDAVLITLEQATSPKWVGFYANDCLTNISLVRDILVRMRSYLRMVGDGPNYYHWEKEYVDSKEESKIMLLTNKQKQLSDEELLRRLALKGY